jgi:WD40 repeat protein
VNSLSYDPSGHWFASASDGGSAKVFDLADTRTSSTPLWQCTGHSDQVRHCVFSEATQSVFATGTQVIQKNEYT